MAKNKKDHPLSQEDGLPLSLSTKNSTLKRQAGQDCLKSLAIYDQATTGELLLIEYENGSPKVIHAVPLPMGEDTKKKFASVVINRPNVYFKYNPVSYQAAKALYGATTCSREDITEVRRIAFDLDSFPKFVKGDEKGKYPKRSDLLKVIERVLPFAMIVSSNGALIDEDGGLHVYLDLEKPTKDIQKVNAIATEILKRLRVELKLLTDDDNLHIDSTSGLERQLRAIGSLRDDGRYVCILQESICAETIEQLEVEFPLPVLDDSIDTSIPISINEQEVVQAFLRVRRSNSEQDGSSRVVTWAKIACDKGVEVDQFLKLVEAAEDQWPLPTADDGFGGHSITWDDQRLRKRYEDVRRTAGVDFGRDARVQQIRPYSFLQARLANPTMREPVIEGLLRVGEIANIIAPPKVGKSFLAGNLALSIITGRPFLGHQVKQGKFLIIDYELHRETLVNRLTRMADAMQIPLSVLDEHLDIYFLRDKEFSLDDLMSLPVKPGFYTGCDLDALYRALPEGTSENDNSQMLSVYRKLGRVASRWLTAMILIHHTSKGSQDGKDTTDVGAGAGSISRAADTHIAIRPHETEGLFVLEAVTRSFKSPEPKSIRFEYPQWVLDDAAPERKRLKTAAAQRKESQNEIDCRRVMVELQKTYEFNPKQLLTATEVRHMTGFNEKRLNSLLVMLCDEGKAEMELKKNDKNTDTRYFKAKLNGELPDECKLSDLF